VQFLSLGYLTTRSWSYWPWFLLPFAVIGFLLCTRIWNAKPASKGKPQPDVGSAPAASSAAAKTGTEG
jgi:MFS transporter, OPA family, glycerol-3-phosphate transporter